MDERRLIAITVPESCARTLELQAHEHGMTEDDYVSGLVELVVKLVAEAGEYPTIPCPPPASLEDAASEARVRLWERGEPWIVTAAQPAHDSGDEDPRAWVP